MNIKKTMKTGGKKFLLLLTALMLVCTVSLAAFAAGETPAETDTAVAHVQNVEAGATVTAYQIVDAVYNENGFVRYEAVSGVSVADPTAPTSDEVSLIAQNVTGLTSVSMTRAENGDYTAALGAGYWLILVEGTGDTIYNPMLAGVYYSVSGSDNTMVSSPVNANDNWTLVTENAYAKMNTPEIQKEIVGSGSGNASGDDLAVGDTVTFCVSTKIPSYSGEYTTVKFDITDTMGEGLTPKKDAVVTVGGEPVGSPNVAVNYEGQTMVVSFASDYILANGLKDVTVTYSATLNENAGVNFNSNDNTAKLTYTHKPGEDKDGAEDTAHVYTFGIDALLNGEGSDVTTEITKTGRTSSSQTTNEPLAGATFKLTNTATNKEYTAVSGADGRLSFTGLDAGTYTLVETAAPSGYTLSNDTHTVVISATYNEDGTLHSYEIKIDDAATSTYTATYAADGTITTIDKTEQGTEIVNTNLPELPSTGGIGIYLFTALGLVLMTVAVLFVVCAARKK